MPEAQAGAGANCADTESGRQYDVKMFALSNKVGHLVPLPLMTEKWHNTENFSLDLCNYDFQTLCKFACSH